MRFVWVVKKGEFDTNKDIYVFYHEHVFSSRKKAEQFIQNGIEINKGTNVVVDKFGENVGIDFKNIISITTDYECLSIDGNPMKIRMVMEKKVLG